MASKKATHRCEICGVCKCWHEPRLEEMETNVGAHLRRLLKDPEFKKLYAKEKAKFLKAYHGKKK